MPAPQQPISLDHRRMILGQAIGAWVMRGARVESQTDVMAVVVMGRPVNHVLHLLLTIFTCFLWGIVWAIIALTSGEKRTTLWVDDFGNVIAR